MAEPMALGATTGGRIVAGSPRYAFIEIKPDYRRLDAVMARIQGIPGAIARAIPPALNKSAAEERTWLAREFGARLRVIRKQSIPDRLELTPKASRTALAAGVRIALTRFTVASFPTQRTAYGIWWTSGDARGGRIIPRSFLQERYTHYLTGQEMGVAQVYRRAQKGEKGFAKGLPTRAGDIVRRYPIKVLRGPSLARVFSDDLGFQAQAETEGVAILEKKVASQVDRIAAEVTK